MENKESIIKKSPLSKLATICGMKITCIKNAANPYFNSKYADLLTVEESLKEPLKLVGLGYFFSVKANEGAWVLSITVYDLTADSVITTSEFPLVNTEAQQFGKALTYGKRYLLTTIFNVIAEEDDDGNSISGNTDKKELPKKSPKAIESLVGDEIPKKFF